VKEYIAKTGGRYTYNDDLLNLQELARSMTSIFEGCSNFIISGCEVIQGRITPGYVWIGGHVRPFEGAADVSFPYYIYEKNHYETIPYAGDIDKPGRCCYLTSGGTAVPQTVDEVTGVLPGYIEMREEYAPRFIDKFIGRYAVLLESPFARQTVRKDLTLAGAVSIEKMLECKTGFSIVNTENGYALRGLVRESGDAVAGLYHRGLLVSRIEIATDGSFTLYRQDMPLVSIGADGVRTQHFSSESARLGALHIGSCDICNTADDTDAGAVVINRMGYLGNGDRFRDFTVYDGRGKVLLHAEGRGARVTVHGAFEVQGAEGLTLRNSLYGKSDAALTGLVQWQDKDAERIAWIGYADAQSFDWTLHNDLGSVVISARSGVDIRGDLRLAGKPIGEIYVTLTAFSEALAGKVDKQAGKRLSTEDFTSEYRQKLDAICQGSLSTGAVGFVTAEDVSQALGGKLSCTDNLADLADKAEARSVLGVYSASECDRRYLNTEKYLADMTELTAAEIEDKSPEQIIALQEERRQAARENIGAEKKGTGELKLSKASNLADVEDKARARQNIGVYSTSEIDKLLEGKLGVEGAYTGALFTAEHKAKLEAIKTGTFAGTDESGGQQSQSEGYVTTSSVVRELTKYAPRLLEGYNAQDKAVVAANLGLYTETEADARFAALGQSLQDYVSYLVRQGKTTVEARKALREVLAAAGVDDLTAYVRRDQSLADLVLKDDNARRLACQNIGAAYAPEYEKKITDTGWLPCGGENAGTLWARQIGNVVCIQGTINTARRASATWGSIATIPNAIGAPRFGCRQTMADFNDDHKYNRGCSFIIRAGERTILMHERGTYNVTTELSFSYMT
jgi:hypothetical protein